MKNLNFQKLNLKTEDFLTKIQMKKILGGEGYGDGGGCKSECSVWNSQTLKMDWGTCTAGSIIVNGTSMPTCDCSIGGTCFN